jgi:hypothetical protein
MPQLVQARCARRDTQILMHILSEFDSHQLQDIGLTRGDIASVAHGGCPRALAAARAAQGCAAQGGAAQACADATVPATAPASSCGSAS